MNKFSNLFPQSSPFFIRDLPPRRITLNLAHRPLSLSRPMNLCRFLTVFSAGLLLSATAPAATFTVTSQEDSGPGSLRQAISDAAGTAGRDTIAFNLAGATPEITLQTPLPGLNGDT